MNLLLLLRIVTNTALKTAYIAKEEIKLAQIC